MTVEEAIKYLKQLYPNGGNCWLDEQRIEAIGMAITALEQKGVTSDDLGAEINKAFLNNECSVTDAVSLSAFTRIARHFANWQKEKASSIVKQYADKGEKNYQESVAESIGAAYQQDVYWDGFRDCANGIKRELED